MWLHACLLILLTTCVALVLADDKTTMKDHMYLPFKESGQFAVLSVSPTDIPTVNPAKTNVDVTFYAHRYPGKSFNGKTYPYARHAEAWCFDEIGTMWNWYQGKHSHIPPKMYLYTLNSPCHEFCVGNIIKFRGTDPFSSSEWYLGYTKLWKTTTEKDLQEIKDADIVLYQIDDKDSMDYQHVSFDSEMKACVIQFLDAVCDSVARDMVYNYIQKVIDTCGKSDADCWRNAKMPDALAKDCEFTITETNDSGNASVRVTVTGENRMEACQMTSQHLPLESDTTLKWKVV